VTNEGFVWLDITILSWHHLISSAKDLPLSLATMSSPPKEKFHRKLSRWFKPKKRIAATSSGLAPVSPSPSQTSIHAEGHGIDAFRTITPQPSGSLAGKCISSTTIQPLGS
jgi:hypothetical protein